MESKVLVDTYALVEFVSSNKHYMPYVENGIVTTKLHLIELYYILLRGYGVETAEKNLELYSRYLVRTTFNGIRRGMQFKLEHRKEKLSYADCIGYAMAAELGMRFLTGDRKFAGRANVEFVR